MKDIFGLDPENLFISSYTDQYFFTFHIMVQIFTTNIKIMMTEKNIDDDGSVIFPKTEGY